MLSALVTIFHPFIQARALVGGVLDATLRALRPSHVGTTTSIPPKVQVPTLGLIRHLLSRHDHLRENMTDKLQLPTILERIKKKKV